MPRSYIAFISYRHEPLDMAVAKELHRSIERYVIPRDMALEFTSRRLGFVFRDQDELPVSSDLSADIKEALDNSKFLIVVCTPATPKSPWVNQEIEYFLTNHPRSNILVVLADGNPSESFPRILTEIQDEKGNITRYVEPLAANVVSDNIHSTIKKLKEEKLRLLAALIGCSYDTLRQRERRYKRTRILRLSAICGVVIMAFMGMLIKKNGEISHQNDILEEQNIALLKSESELLANTAAMQLEDGDYYNAIANAIQSLPANDDRPYVPNGAQILADALGVYDVGNSNVTGILKQDTEVFDVIFSGDGKYAFTIDIVGRIIAFDIASNEQLWSTLVEADYEIYSPYMYYISENHSVLVKIGSTIQSYSATDGSILWSCVLNSPMSSYAAISNDQRILAVDDNIEYAAYLRFISVQDGKEYGNVLFDSEWPKLTSLQSNEFVAAREVCNLGIFTESDDEFIGFYMIPQRNARYYYSVDLKNMEIQKFYTDTVQASDDSIIFGMSYEDSEHKLLVLQRNNYDTILTVKCISLQSSSVLFETDIDMDDNWLYINEEDNVGVVFKNERIYLYYGNKLCAFDTNTGERRGMFEFDSDIVLIKISDNNDQFVAVLTEDGDYTLHTVGKRVTDLSSLLGSIHFDREISQAHSLNDGYWDLIECDLEYGPEGKGVYIAVERNDSGVMAIIPSGNPNQVLIEQLNFPNEANPKTIPTPAIPEPPIDFSTQDCTERIELSVPPQNIESAHLFDDANYLALISNTEQLFIYDVQNGELVFSEYYIARYQDFLGNIYNDDSCVVFDDEHRWLFIYSQNGHGDGILIDVDSWTRLASIPQMSGYCPESCEVIISKGGNERNGSLTESSTYILPVYDTATLVDLGKAVIKE